jgi:sulfotransferase
MSKPTLFFQSSMPRAGSTLLQNILGQNPDFHVTPTSGLLELIFGARHNFSNCPEFKAQDSALMKKAYLSFCREGMYGYAQALTDKPYMMDKCRGWSVHFDLLTEILGEEPKIICMVRDLRQIVASMERLFRENRFKAQPVENHAKLMGTTVIKRVNHYMQNAPVGLAMDRLMEVHMRGWGPKICFVRYEDLTTKPGESLEKIYNYLGVKAYQHNFDKVTQVTEEDDRVNGFDDLHTIREKVEIASNDYVKMLTMDGVRYLEQNYAWYFNRFAYPATPKVQ